MCAPVLNSHQKATVAHHVHRARADFHQVLIAIAHLGGLQIAAIGQSLETRHQGACRNQRARRPALASQWHDLAKECGVKRSGHLITRTSHPSRAFIRWCLILNSRVSTPFTSSITSLRWVPSDRASTPVHAAARLDKHRAPRAAAGYKTSSVALVSTALPPDGIGNRNIERPREVHPRGSMRR